MAKKLSDLPNIGTELEKMLINVDITTPEILKKVGSIQACKRLNISGLACYNKLYALEGAIQNIRWHSLSKEFREQVKQKYDLEIGKKSKL